MLLHVQHALANGCKEVDILESSCDIPSVTPPSDAFIIDGAAMVNSRPPGQQTFLAYANDVILSYRVLYR